ncbi:hypothetical protein [Telluribacter sp.]|jgi:hypothetical protein|uniref:hypothetical protein n=1 Tax=Telluribacter sp. TaxID=1978767 RepID=UPI002E11277F|nr:hypothetical protein [Telluribacter sp.]
MTYDQFVASLDNPAPPSQASEVLVALWHDAKGEWQAAHEIAQSREGTRDYDRLHAYLHRVEGDNWNANYWYRRAGATMPAGTLKEEWTNLVKGWL